MKINKKKPNKEDDEYSEDHNSDDSDSDFEVKKSKKKKATNKKDANKAEPPKKSQTKSEAAKKPEPKKDKPAVNTDLSKRSDKPEAKVIVVSTPDVKAAAVQAPSIPTEANEKTISDQSLLNKNNHTESKENIIDAKKKEPKKKDVKTKKTQGIYIKAKGLPLGLVVLILF